MGALDSQRLVPQSLGFQELSCRKVTHGAVASGQPWLVCLHGLLGSGEDWLPVLPFCRDWPVLLVDLPGHGASRTIATADFADVSRQLSATLLAQGITRYWLLGYSLGGRIAMYHACTGQHDGMLGLLVEGDTPVWRRPSCVRSVPTMMHAGRSAFVRNLCLRSCRTGISRRSLLMWIQNSVNS